MNTFSAFRCAARTLLHPGRHLAHFPYPIAPHAGVHVRFKKTKARPLRRPRNETIPYESVSLVNDDKTLTKISLKRLLKTINYKEEWVELIVEEPEPIVKIVNKRWALSVEKEAKEKRREGARNNIVKEMQLTWGSEQGDLDHKLARARSYLEMGAKVDIVYSTKPKTVPPLAKVQQEKVQSTIESLADISKEWKPVEWRRNMAAIFLKGTDDRKLTPEQMQLAEEEGVGKGEPAAKDRGEVDPEPTRPATPPPPAPQLDSQPGKPKHDSQPGKPKYFADLSGMGYTPPPRRNPLSAMRDEKKYGTRPLN